MSILANFDFFQVTLTCEVDSNPPPTYTWTKGDSRQVSNWKTKTHVRNVIFILICPGCWLLAKPDRDRLKEERGGGVHQDCCSHHLSLSSSFVIVIIVICCHFSFITIIVTLKIIRKHYRSTSATRWLTGSPYCRPNRPRFFSRVARLYKVPR